MLSVEELNVAAQMKGGETVSLVDHLSFFINKGEKLAIVGQSGCGKTMTAMAILGLLPDNCSASGKIRWENKDLLSLTKHRRRAFLGKELVWIPQSGADFLNPSRTVGSQMRESLLRNGLRSEEALYNILARVGFQAPETILRAYPFQLSGGMAQRVVMAMSALGHPGLVIADEPTRGIDRENTAHFISLMEDLFCDSAVLLITHDISVAAVCDRILVMNSGRMVESGNTEQVLHSPKESYTQKLIRDLPGTISDSEGELCF